MKDVFGGLNHNAKIFIDVIHENFKDIECDSNLKHDIDEIRRLVKSNSMYTIFAYDNDNIVGYLIGEIIETNNTLCFHIGYLYVTSTHRCHGIASKLIKTLNDKIQKSFDLDKITLTCNTNNIYNLNFYKKKGFLVDKLYANTDKYCVMSMKL
jgi:ribosomal protein S18 acetylase RimI-like enzyme